LQGAGQKFPKKLRERRALALPFSLALKRKPD
jgi:hypothetical protein